MGHYGQILSVPRFCYHPANEYKARYKLRFSSYLARIFPFPTYQRTFSIYPENIIHTPGFIVQHA